MRTIFQFILFAFISLIVLNSCKKKTNQERESRQTEDDWFINQRIFPSGKIDYSAYRNAVNYVISNTNKSLRGGYLSKWQYAGPDNVGGRITDVEMHYSSQDIMYLCAASGGIFKSKDKGITWKPIFDSQPSLSIGDLAIAPSDANTLYAGTGEANAGGGSITYDGMGVFKSIDAGSTWRNIGLDSTRNTGRIAIHPYNKNVLYVATMGDLFGNNSQRGLYKTLNGGNSWQKILFLNDSTGAIDIVIHPKNPDTIFACMWTRIRRPDRRNYGGKASGIYRSFNGGLTWTNITNGLFITGKIGRIGIDISQSNPDILCVTITNDYGNNIGVFRTNNLGNTWENLNYPFGSVSGYWYGRIKIDPTDPNILFMIDFNLVKTTNGGLTWNEISTSIHPDQHEVYIHPLNNNLILLANDGGLYLSMDGGEQWTSKKNLPITQFYSCEVDEQNPKLLSGGAQDNGVVTTPTGKLNDWYTIWGGDGFQVLVDPKNPSVVYKESQYGNINVGINGIEGNVRFNWNTPFVLNPLNSNSLFIGTNKVYKSTNQGVDWNVISPDLTNNTQVATSYPIVFETVTTIAVSSVDSNIIYAGTDDGHVWITTNNGLNWINISKGLPVRWITHIATDPSNFLSAYVTLSGYRYHDNMSHVYVTNNGGQDWTDIGGNLPDVPINDIVVDSTNSSLYIASDVGVFYTNSKIIDWKILGSALPFVPITDLRLHYPTRTLLAATYGRSMYKFDLNLITDATNEKQINHKISMQLSPNPFVDHANVELILPLKLRGRLSIIDLNGQEIKMIKQGVFNEGINNISVSLNQKEKGILNEGIVFIKFNSVSGESKSIKALYMH